MAIVISAENIQKLEFDVTTGEGPCHVTVITGSLPINLTIGATPQSVKTLVDPTLQPGQFRKAVAVVSFINISTSIPGQSPPDPNIPGSGGFPGAFVQWFIDDVEATLDDESSKIVLRMDIGGNNVGQTYSVIGRIGFQVTTLARV
jgi:hypothetical protein